MGAAFGLGWFVLCVSTVAGPLPVVVTVTGLQAAGSLPGAFFGTTFTLLYPPLPCDLLNAVPFLQKELLLVARQACNKK